jgi:hypothetical protein
VENPLSALPDVCYPPVGSVGGARHETIKIAHLSLTIRSRRRRFPQNRAMRGDMCGDAMAQITRFSP